jgi:hypothetical protein
MVLRTPARGLNGRPGHLVTTARSKEIGLRHHPARHDAGRGSPGSTRDRALLAVMFAQTSYTGHHQTSGSKRVNNPLGRSHGDLLIDSR